MEISVRKKIIALCIFAILAVLFFILGPKDQNNLTFDVKMNKTQALDEAKTIGKKLNWNVENSISAANFSINEAAQTYFELQVGNYNALNTLIENEEGYIPAQWAVKLIPKNDSLDYNVYFTPSGKPYGFSKKILDATPGAALSDTEARSIGEKEASTNWDFKLSDYALIGTKKDIKANGRIDYTFTYERNKAIGEAKDKISLIVSGSELTEMKHFLDIPEVFSREYEQKRAANDTIALASSIAFYIVLFIIGLFCLFYLSKQKMLLWKKPLLLTSFIVIITILANVSNIKTYFLSYDPTLMTPSAYSIISVLGIILEGIGTGIFTFISIVIGEGLTRKAFPKHIQFWKQFSFKNVHTKQFLNKVIIAYVFLILMFIYETTFYSAMRNVPGWWNPSSLGYDPNLQGNSFAFLEPLSTALNAGVFEEFAFRAIPISLGVLIGNKYNKRKFTIAFAFIFEILMFSAGHANYPGFPPYARLVELLVVAFGFGLIYYNFGLLPGIITHFTYDLILMSWDILSTSSNALVPSKIIISVIIILPLLSLLIAKLKHKSFAVTDESLYNSYWFDKAASTYEYSNSKFEASSTNINSEGTIAEKELMKESNNMNTSSNIVGIKNGKPQKIFISILGIIMCAIITLGIISVKNEVLPISIERSEAETLAKQKIEAMGYSLSADWKVSSEVYVNTDNIYDDFVKREGMSKYKELLGKYLNPTKWMVRFIKTTGDVNERTEEFTVTLIDQSHDMSFTHTLPKNKAGETLSKEKAEETLFKTVKEVYGLDKVNINEVSASEVKLEARTDWSFVLEDTSVNLKEYKPRIKAVVTGNEVSNLVRTTEPTEKIQIDMNKRNTSMLLWLLPLIIFVGVVFFIFIIQSIIGWTKKQIDKPSFFKLFILLLILKIASLLLNSSSAIIVFSTAQPYNLQIATHYILGLIGALFASFILASIGGYSKYFSKNTSKLNFVRIAFPIVIGLVSIAASIINAEGNSIPILSSYCALSSSNKFLGQIIYLSNNYLQFSIIAIEFCTFLKKLKTTWSRLIIALSILNLLAVMVQMMKLEYTLSSTKVLLLYFGGLILCAVLCIVIILIFEKVYKPDTFALLLTTAVTVIINSLKEINIGQYPTLNTSIVISIIFVAALSLYLYISTSRNA